MLDTEDMAEDITEGAAEDITSLPEDRSEAFREGEMFFYSGLPCKHGHFSKRYTTSGACYECVRLREAERRDMYQQAKRRRAEADAMRLAEQQGVKGRA